MDLRRRPILGGYVELITSDAGAPAVVETTARPGRGGRFVLRTRSTGPYFIRVVPATDHNGGYIRAGSFASYDPAGRDVWSPGDDVDASVGLTWMAGRMVDSLTRSGVRGVLVQARTTGPGVAPTVVTARSGRFVVRGLVGDLVDEEYTVCVDGRAVGYQAGQFQPTTHTVEGTSCADGLGSSASAGWLGNIAIDRLPR
jgi:hypothetical protein